MWSTDRSTHRKKVGKDKINGSDCIKVAEALCLYSYM